MFQNNIVQEVGRLIKEPEWKFEKTKTKIVQILDINEEKRELDVFDLEALMPFVIDVPSNLLIDEIQKGQTYRATFKVFVANLTPDIEKLWEKESKASVAMRKSIETMKQSGAYGKLYKFELVSLKPT